MKADAKTKAEVKALLRSYAKAYAGKDVAALLAHMSQESDSVHVGTGKDEVFSGGRSLKKGIVRTLEQCDKLKLSYGKQIISAAGRVAWLYCDCRVSASAAGKRFDINGRLTAVCEKRGDAWIMVQSHFSVPDAAQASGQSFPRPKTLRKG